MKVLFIVLVSFLIVGCTEEPEVVEFENTVVLDNYFQVTGLAQGTTYSIIYQDSLKRDLSNSLDSILKNYDSYLSTYVDTSLISQFNNSKYSPTSSKTRWENDFMDMSIQPDGIFEDCFKAAKRIYKTTDGAFNPAIYPLVNYWGFFNGEMRTDVSQNDLDSILRIVDFSDSMISLYIDTVSKGGVIFGSTPVVGKMNGNVKIDFNGIAQGHSVDVIGNYLWSLGINNYMVEIGGEVLCKGVNNKNSLWQIAVDKPVENSSPGSEGFQLVVGVNDQAIATSGNYRKFYEKDGVKYAHTISPKTGYPVQHSLLSVTVMTDKCVDADGYATAFMVMGMENTQNFIKENPELHLEVYLVALNANDKYVDWMTEGFRIRNDK